MVNSTVTAIVLVLLLIVQVYAGPALYVNRAQVNVRSDATVQSARVAVLQDGEELEQIGSENEWYHVRMVDGRDGWVHSALVQRKLTVAGRGVRVRAAASTVAPAFTMVFAGTELTQIREQGNWIEVNLPDGKTGWIWKKLVRNKTISFEALPARDSQSGSVTTGLIAEPEVVVPTTLVATEEINPVAVRENPYAEGLKFEEKGDYRSALTKFAEVLDEDPDNINALAHVATAHKQLGAYDEAVKNLSLARDKSSGRRDILLELGEVYRLKGLADSTRKYQALFRGESWLPEPKFVQEKETLKQPPKRDDTWFSLGIGAVALIVVTAVVVLLRRTHKKAVPKKAPAQKGSDRFSRALEESKAQDGGPVASGSESEIDHRIKEKWEELRQGSEELISTRADDEGSESEYLDHLVVHLDLLRQALEMQDERARTYADLVRLQNMKIEAMNDEIRLLRRGGSR